MNQNKKTKRFLIPILTLVLTSIISIVFIITYININVFEQHMQNDIESHKKEYLKKNKDIIYKKVHLANNAIKFQKAQIENKLKISLKERVETALKIATFIYNKQKNNLSKEEMIKRVVEHLASLNFNNGRGFYVTSDYKTNKIIGHKIKEFIGKDMTNFKDTKGDRLITLKNKAVKDGKIGFFKIYFNKPNNTKNEYPKLNAAALFKPLNIVIGTGEYLDVVKKQLQNMIKKRFENLSKDKNTYIFFLKLHNINGGDNFATMILNPNREDLIGKELSDNHKDVKGKEFRKEFLEGLRKDGECYTKYWYKKPNKSSGVDKSDLLLNTTNEPKPKLSYFYLNKDWNWILASGFYYDDLNKQISTMKQSIETYTKKTIYDSIKWVLILSLIVIVIAVFVSLSIDKTIRKYMLGEYEKSEELKQKQKLLMSQEKLASMGDMIGNIAHQWRQPLSIISTGATGMKMQKEFDTLSDEQFLNTCDLINDNAQYLSKTIDDFRNFIKGDRDKKVFNLKDNINSFLHLVEGSVKNHNLNIILDLKEDIKIDGYPNELTQCLINIFNNAKDVIKKQNNRYLFISTLTQEDKAIIKIKDNGGGIPKDILPKIFEPYFTTKHQSQGTGLGLHMTYNLIVDGMGGTVEATNVEYEYDGENYVGAEFLITLPMNKDEK